MSDGGEGLLLEVDGAGPHDTSVPGTARRPTEAEWRLLESADEQRTGRLR
jgi:hypothetical protein